MTNNISFSVSQKDDEIARLRKELETRKSRAIVNTQENSALEKVRTNRKTLV